MQYLSATADWTYFFYTILQVIVLIYLVCFVSGLPQFWEYEVSETWDYGHNQTLALSQASVASDSPEYKVMYFWYVANSENPQYTILKLHCTLQNTSTPEHLHTNNLGSSGVIKDPHSPLQKVIRSWHDKWFKTKVPEWRCFVVWMAWTRKLQNIPEANNTCAEFNNNNNNNNYMIMCIF